MPYHVTPTALIRIQPKTFVSINNKDSILSTGTLLESHHRITVTLEALYQGRWLDSNLAHFVKFFEIKYVYIRAVTNDYLIMTESAYYFFFIDQ